MFPVARGQKIPCVKNWQNWATCDIDRVVRWWKLNDHNIGIFTGKWHGKVSEHSLTQRMALLVLDIDNKHGKRGDESLELLELQGFELTTPMLTVRTPTGGRHLYYVVEHAVRQGANVFGPGIDVRSRGGYVVGPGSETKDGRYEVI